MATINWKKGLFRLWIIFSVMRAALISIDERPDKQLRRFMEVSSDIQRFEEIAKSYSDQVNLDETKLVILAEAAKNLRLLEISQLQQGALVNGLISYLQSAFVPILIAFGIGYMLIWALSGFARHRPF